MEEGEVSRGFWMRAVRNVAYYCNEHLRAGSALKCIMFEYTQPQRRSANDEVDVTRNTQHKTQRVFSPSAMRSARAHLITDRNEGRISIVLRALRWRSCVPDTYSLPARRDVNASEPRRPNGTTRNAMIIARALRRLRPSIHFAPDRRAAIHRRVVSCTVTRKNTHIHTTLPYTHSMRSRTKR